MTWSKAWTASESVTNSETLNRVLGDFFKNLLTTRGWTVTEPPTMNTDNTTNNVWGLEKTYTLFGGTSYIHSAVYYASVTSNTASYAIWDGPSIDPLIDGYPEPSTLRVWGNSRYSVSYTPSNSNHYGVWEAWVSDQDSESYVLFGGATSKKLIGWSFAADTRFAGPDQYSEWPVLGYVTNPQMNKVGNSTDYLFRPCMSPNGAGVATTGTGPYLMNYPTIGMYYSSSSYILGRTSTNDWLEMSSMGSSVLGSDITAVTYNSNNYIKVGGSTSWLLNTGATVPLV